MKIKNINLIYKLVLTILSALNLMLHPMQKDINNNNNINYFKIIFSQFNLIKNRKKLQDLLDKNIELKKEFDKNEENINKNENQIQELINNSKNSLLSTCFFNIFANKKYKELIYPVIKTKFVNKLSREQLCELLAILIKFKDKNLKIFAKIILDQDDIDLNNLNITHITITLPFFKYYLIQLPILIYATVYNDKPTVEFLIKKGIDLNIKDGIYGETALKIASSRGYTEIVNLLIENGAKLDIPNKLGITSLIAASYSGYIEIVSLLISKGAKIDIQDNDGITALMEASSRGYKEIVNLLIEKNANLDIKDRYGQTALMHSLEEEYTEIARILIEKGANINIQNKFGINVLNIAQYKNYNEIMSILIEKTTNNNSKNS